MYLYLEQEPNWERGSGGWKGTDSIDYEHGGGGVTWYLGPGLMYMYVLVCYATGDGNRQDVVLSNRVC